MRQYLRTTRTWIVGPPFGFAFTAPFRLFLLIAAVQAIAVVAIGPAISVVHSPEAAAAWHAHELLFGYLPAVQAGVLLTAVSTWTGRRLIAGPPLAALAALWISGRVAVAILGVGSAAAAVAVTAFPAVLAAMLGRELMAARRFDQLPVISVLAVMVIALPAFHWEIAAGGRSVFAERVAIAAVMVQFMALIGRFIPMFTRDFLTSRGGPMPAAFGPFDVAAIAFGILALCIWIVLPALGAEAHPIGAILIAAAVLHLVRQVRWKPERTLREPLLAVLHAGYGALPLGFAIAGTAAMVDAPRLAFSVIHIWAIGGTGLMTLALMTRVTLGHTGRPLRALAGTTLLYAAIGAALVARVSGVLAADWAFALMPLAGLAWTCAYAGFLVIYGPLLVTPDMDTSPP